ncbi:MAG: right-handed parallel beta-helix repeat-containing protein [Planctomycetaceae bacterium]|nr:right-handed parallel beta-helix repeat-containing protein [Planctomycetaceae bacterium]
MSIQVTPHPLPLRFRIAVLLFSSVAAATPCSAEAIKVPGDAPTVAAAMERAVSGDTILVAAGTYHEAVVVQPGVTLRSQGDDAEGNDGLLRAERTIIDLNGIDVTTAAGVVLSEGSVLDGFTVTGVGKYDDQLWQHHFETHGNEQSHDDIGHFGKPAIGVEGVTCRIVHNLVHHNGGTGIGIRGAAGRSCRPQVVSNICFRNMGGGIGSMEGSTAIIEGNKCYENFYAGIGHDNASPTVRRNKCYGNVRAGIGISHGSCPIVEGNHCYQNRRAGIGIRTGPETRPTVLENECHENGMAGIGVEEHASPVLLRNRCLKNGMAGIGVSDGASATILENTCDENLMAGIGCENSGVVTISTNTCRRNHDSGIGVRGALSQATIHGNLVEENGKVAIGVPDGASVIISNNQLTRTGGMPPLVAIRGGSRAIVTRNEFTGGGIASLLIEGTATVTENDFRSSSPEPRNAVWIWKSSHGRVENNRLHGTGRIHSDSPDVIVTEESR